VCLRKQTGKPPETKFPIFQNLHHLLDRTVPYSKLLCNFSDCYPSVLSDELVDFLLVALSCSSSRSTTERLIGDVRVPSLKCFTHLLTLLAPMQTSPYTPLSRSQMIPAEFLIFHKEFNKGMLTKRHVGDSHFLAVHDGNVRGAHALIFRSYLREKTPLMVL
jgi:hypothetical protein